MSDDYIQLIKSNILDRENFFRAVFSGQRRKEYVPWIKVVIRPVLIKDERHVQFSYFETQKNITKNYAGAEIAEKLEQLLALPFKNYHVETGSGNIQVQMTKKGKAIVHRSKIGQQRKSPNLAHDR